MKIENLILIQKIIMKKLKLHGNVNFIAEQKISLKIKQDFVMLQSKEFVIFLMINSNFILKNLTQIYVIKSIKTNQMKLFLIILVQIHLTVPVINMIILKIVVKAIVLIKKIMKQRIKVQKILKTIL